VIWSLFAVVASLVLSAWLVYLIVKVAQHVGAWPFA